MPEIIFCCGKICSGKSTFAKYLENEYMYFHFSADEWMLHFYKETSDRLIFERNLQKCKDMIYKLSEKILSKSMNVVLDFGFWTNSERQQYKRYFIDLGYQATIVYFPITFDNQIKNMKQRQIKDIPNHYKFSVDSIKELNSKFEEPNEEEAIQVREYCSKNNMEFIIKATRPDFSVKGIEE
jgi:predicted kinase